jgi:hypothetical protein
MHVSRLWTAEEIIDPWLLSPLRPSAPLGHARASHADTPHADHDNFAAQLRMNRLGLWLFFISEAFLFGGLLAARFYLLGRYPP